MTDDPDPCAAHTDPDRMPDGKFAPGNSLMKPPWPKGTSGNPSGRSKGYQMPAKRLQNLVGGEEGWSEMEPELLEIMRGEGDPDGCNGRSNLLKLISIVVSNDHALLKARDPDDTSQHEQAAGFVVRPPEDEGKVTDDGEPSE